MTSEPLNLAAIEAREVAASRHIADLCNGKKRWTMRIPAQPGHDSDLVISDSLRDVLSLTSEVRRLRKRHDPRCLCLTDSESNVHCDCRTLAAIDGAKAVTERAERAEAERDAARAEVMAELLDARRRAEQAEAEVEQLSRELAIARINPEDHIDSESWSEDCQGWATPVPTHDMCDWPSCTCPCHGLDV